MKLTMNLHFSKGDQVRIVPVQIQGKDLDDLTPEKLWQTYLAMQKTMEEIKP